jgi:hypothetical protein
VSGEVVGTAPLEVRVVVHNPGGRIEGPLEVVGELLGERREARVSSGLPASGTAAVVLPLLVEPSRPGLHALVLLLEHPAAGPPDAAGNPPVESQRAWLLLALGARPEPAVRMSADPVVLDVRRPLTVRLESADGTAHRVRLRGWPPRGLRFETPEALVDVPSDGEVRASIPLIRAGASRDTRQGVLVVAENVDGPLARTAVAAAIVDVAPDPSVLPRLQWPLLGAGVVLLALAALAEERGRR